MKILALTSLAKRSGCPIISVAELCSIRSPDREVLGIGDAILYLSMRRRLGTSLTGNRNGFTSPCHQELTTNN